MKIHLVNAQKDLPLDKRAVRSAARHLLSFLKISCAEIGIYFVSEKEISRLHGKHFADPTPTDCISFPIDEEFLGEIFICPAVAIAYAKRKGFCPKEETVLYLVHGLLHLIGYDDLDPGKKRIMRKKEKSCMGYLKGLPLWAHFS